jgi:hypothetical protein
VGRGAPAVCGRAEGGKGDTTFLLSTSVVVYCHAGLLSRCKLRGGVKTKRRKSSNY